MAVSGSTTTTSVEEAIYAVMLADALIEELRPAEFMRSHMRMAPFPGTSDSHRFLLVDQSTTNNVLTNASATLDTNVGTDGTAFTVREFETVGQTAVATVKGTNVAVADFTKAITGVDVESEIVSFLRRTLAHQFEYSMCANLANFSNTTTAAAGALAVEDLLSAIAGLEQRDVTAGKVGGFHPKQLGDLRADITGRTGEVWGKPGNDLQGTYREAWGSLFGVPLYASTVVGSSGGNYQGAIFAENEALGLIEAWSPKIEIWRDGRALLDYVVASDAYGSCEIDDLRGQTILSSTT
jgi:hypothetical protein